MIKGPQTTIPRPEVNAIDEGSSAAVDLQGKAGELHGDLRRLEFSRDPLARA
jgi:hypothetical protein